MLGVKKNFVRLEPHDEQWRMQFEVTQSEIRQILGLNVIDIQHVGSTAIKGIVAKPILDLAVIISDSDAINFDGMKNHGYVYGGEAGVPGRFFFVKYKDDDISTHHIHCYKSDNRNLLANIAFRDYLIQHPDYALQYNDLKLRLAEKYSNDRIMYTNEKSDFIKKILQLAHFSA